MNLNTLQGEVAEWGLHNFPEAKPYHPLLGAQEEVGELSHAHLKQEQGIRQNKASSNSDKEDAIGDIVIFLAHYCELNNIDFQSAVFCTWDKVKQRDWIKFPVNGKDK